MIIEAMSCGIPPVVTPMDGVSLDSVTPGETGIVVGSCAELAAALVELLRNDELRERLAANARRDVLRRFALTQVADQYMAMYDELS